MQRKRGIVLQPNSQTNSTERSEGLIRPAKRARGDNEDRPATSTENSRSGSPDQLNKSFVQASLKDWVWVHLDPGVDTADALERRAALTEVGELLILGETEYPDADRMKEEIADLVAQLGAQSLLDDYISFLLETRTRAKVPHEPVMIHPHPVAIHAQPMYPPGMYPPGMPFYPYPPEYFPGVPPQFAGHHFMPPQRFQPPAPRGGNMVLSRSNEPTPVQKLKERESKRKELLQNYTEELKQLVAKSAEAPDELTRQKYLDFIEAVKKKIAALSAAAPAPPRPVRQPSQPPAGIVGYFGNQYINPDAPKPKPDAQ